MSDPYQPDRPMICPYDKNHRIATSRIQGHLVKCARNFPPDYKVTCPYNATHRLFKSELQHHMASCPDYQHVDPIIYELHHKQGAAMSCVPSETQSIIDCEESWDEEEGSFCRITSPANGNSYALRSGGTSFAHSAPRFQPVKGLPIESTNRPPYGLAEAFMIEASGESGVEDIESVTSFKGLGRGKPWNEPRTEVSLKIGRGRGSAQAKDQI